MSKEFWKHIEQGDLLTAYKAIDCDGVKLWRLVIDNADRFQKLDCLEPLFILAWYQFAPRESPQVVRDTLQKCDRQLLLSATDPLPVNGPYRVYRGVRQVPYPYCSRYADRIENGLSWTPDINYAATYAAHLSEQGAYSQSILTATVSKENVYCFIDSPFGTEFICEVTEWTDLDLSLQEIRRLAGKRKTPVG